MQLVLFDSLVLGVSPWWTPAVAEGLGLRCLVVVAVGTLVLSVLLRAMWNLPGGSTVGRSRGDRASATSGRGRHGPRGFRDVFRRCRGFGARLSGESGTATVEFVLVFPVALVICLILLQTVLVFTGNLFVNYAAYAAVRSAIVQAPDGRAGGGGELSYGSPAVAAVERAAAYAMVPVAGKGLDSDASAASSGDGIPDEKGDPAGSFVAGLNTYFGGSDDAPAWVENLAGARMRYALRHTEVNLYETRIADNGVPELIDAAPPTEEGEARTGGVAFGPKDPVTVGVSHRLHLSIPFVSKIFEDGTHETQGGDTPYALVSATCTMTLEGYDRELPPLPIVERE